MNSCGTRFMIKLITFQKTLLFIGALYLITGCSGPSTQTSYIDSDINAAQEYLERAQNAKGTERSDWLMRAVEALYEAERPEKALSVLQQINTLTLTPLQRDWYHSLLGQGLLKAERLEESITQFRSVVDITQLKVNRQIAYYDLFANVLSKSGRYFEAVKQRIAHLALVTDELEQEAIKELLWQELLAIPNPALYQTSLNSREVEGWLNLAIIANNFADQPEGMIRALELWTSRYKSIIPTNLIPLDLSQAMSVQVYKPNRIAVLLPLTGSLANSAEHIRRGLMAAHFSQPNDTELVFLDTNNIDILALYQQAIDLESEFVIGPLQQSKVKQLAQSEYLPIPVLAINRLQNDNILSLENLYQFGLPIEDEVNLIANHVLSKGEARGLLLLPETNTGDRAQNAFETVFALNDADVQQIVRYKEDGDYSKPVQQMLGIDQSLQRHRRLQQLTGVELEFQARRRQDIDFIFFIANPATGRRIKPFIDFYYAHDVSVYSSSSIFRGVEDEVLDNDLNNIQFPTLPFLVSDSTATTSLKGEIDSNWQDSKQGLQANLFALGFDSYQIIPELSKLRFFPNYRQNGLTGTLTVNQQGQVLRNLPWATFVQGKIEVTNTEGPDVTLLQETSSPQ